MNKKRGVLVFVFLFMVVVLIGIVSAVWWNPGDWFERGITGEVVVAPDNLMGYYTFEDSNTADSSGRGNDGEVLGEFFIAYDQEREGFAAYFDGNVDVVVVESAQNDFNFEYNDGFSVCVWVSPENLWTPGMPKHYDIVGKVDHDAGYKGWDFRIWDDNLLALQLVNDWQGGKSLFAFSKVKLPIVNPAIRKWTHVCVTYDGSSLTDGVKFYINGNDAGKDDSHVLYSNSLGTNSIQNNIPVTIGRRYFDTENIPFNGMMDDVMIWNKELSAGEIVDVYGSVPTGVCDDSQIIMRLDSERDAYGFIWDQDSYAERICYPEIFGESYSGDNPHGCMEDLNNGVVLINDTGFGFIQTVSKYDQNNDGVIDYDDSQIVIDCALGRDPPGGCTKADIDGNGRVDAVDVQIQINAGLGYGVDKGVFTDDDRKHDIDNSLFLNGYDIQRVWDCALGRDPPGGCTKADIDGNGRVDAVDIQLEINYILNLNYKWVCHSDLDCMVKRNSEACDASHKAIVYLSDETKALFSKTGGEGYPITICCDRETEPPEPPEPPGVYTACEQLKEKDECDKIEYLASTNYGKLTSDYPEILISVENMFRDEIPDISCFDEPIDDEGNKLKCYCSWTDKCVETYEVLDNNGISEGDCKVIESTSTGNCPEEDYILTWGASWKDTGNENAEYGCVGGSKTISCPSTEIIPFFTIINLILASMMIGLIYFLFERNFWKKK